MTIPTAPPTGDSAPPAAPPRSDRFFSWIAGLGVARSEGWVGGVAAGIAAQLRIDPLIVRGVLVVATLCGLPLILLYAIAWALLPDAEGRIHARALLHGRFEPAQLGILAGIVIGLLTLWPLSALALFFRLLTGPYNGYDYGFGGPTPLSVLGFLFGLALVIVLLVLIVRAARRTPGEIPADPRTAPDPVEGSAASAPPAASVSARDSDIAAETDATSSDAAASDAVAPASAPVPLNDSIGVADASAPVEPSRPADAADVEAWRAQHAAWQEQDRAWRAQQQDADRAAREQARREREEAAAAFSAEAAERRRIRRASKPRASFAYVATAIGLALVVGAVVWLWSPTAGVVTAALALFTATLVLAFGMIIAGIARRRSGFLAFVTVITLVGSLVAGVAATLGDVRFGQVNVSNGAPVNLRQPFGATFVYLVPLDAGRSAPITVHKGDGFTDIQVSPGVELDLTATVRDADVSWTSMLMDDDGSSLAGTGGEWTGTAQADGTRVIRQSVASAPDPTATSPADVTRVPVTIDQDSGLINITYYVTTDSEGSE